MTVDIQTECPFDNELRAFRDHAMPEKRREEVRAHIRTCDACRAAISLMKAVDAELKSWANLEPVPDGLRGRILAAMSQSVTDLPITRKKRLIGKLAWQTALTGAAVMIVAVIIFPMFAKSREKARQSSPAAAAKEAQLEAEDAQSQPLKLSVRSGFGNDAVAPTIIAGAPAHSLAGAETSGNYNYYATPQQSPGAQQEKATTGAIRASSASPFIPSEDINYWRDYSRKIVYTATMDITVPKLGAAEQQAVALIQRAGGYVATSTSDMADASNPNGTWTLRVPCYNFESFVAQMEHLGKVNTLHRESQDVTDQYKDLRAQINNKRIEENRLQNLLATRNRLSDVVDMEQQLSDVQSEIEQLQGQLNVVEHQAAFSTITLTMEESSPAPAAPASFGSQLGAAFKGSISEIGGWGGGLLVWFAGAWPWLLVVAVVAIAISGWIRRHQRSREDD